MAASASGVSEAPHEPLPPMSVPIIINVDQRAWVPDAFIPGAIRYVEICNGLGVAWAPIPEEDAALLVIAAGNPARPGEDLVATTLTRAGLRGLISDLQSIDAQMGEG